MKKKTVSPEQIKQHKEALKIINGIELGDPQQVLFVIAKGKEKGVCVAVGDKDYILAAILGATEEDEGLAELLVDSSLLTALRRVREYDKMEKWKSQGKVARD